MTHGVLYYSCLTHDARIETACRQQLLHACGDRELVSVTRGAAIVFGHRNIVVEGPRGPVTMHRQILAGLEAITADRVFLCESDVLYHPSHFDAPEVRDAFLYNTHVWKVRATDGLAVWTDDLQQVSGVCADRDVLLDFYRQRVAQIEREGFNRHYEPGVKQSLGLQTVQNWQSAVPNVCIRHDRNLTQSKWSPTEFRNPQYAKGWAEADGVPGWGKTRERFWEWLGDQLMCSEGGR